MLSTNASFKLLTRNIDKSLAQIAAAPDTKRETDYYLKTIGSIKSIDDLLANDRVYTYAMKAFGLKDMVYAKAFVKKVLTEGIDTAQSFSNQLSDPRFKDLAATFNFKSYGTATTAFTKAQQGVADKYVQMGLEEKAGQDNEGVRLALYFRRKAGGISSAFSILGDAALLKVAQVALNLPAATSSMDIDAQAKLIGEKIDIAKISDPAVLDKFLTRFTTLWELNNGTSSTVPAVMLSQGLQSLTSTDTLMKIQSLRRGGRS